MVEIAQNASFIQSIYVDATFTDGQAIRYDSATGKFGGWTPDHADLANKGTTSHANLDTHYGDATLHFTEASIDHTAITNIGTNTHAQIDTAVGNSAGHISAAAPHSGHATTGDLTTHTGAAAPHSGHEQTANKGAVNGYCGLDAGGLVDGDDLPAASITKKGAVPVLENTATKVLYDNGTWAVPPGAVGGEANTMSSQGGGLSIYKQKTVLDLEIKSLNSTQFAAATDLISLVVAAPGPDYVPPAIKYKDAGNITIPAGTYWPLGWRLDGQYQDHNYIPWTVAAAFDVDVDDAGNLVGGDVVSSWYSVFMTAAGTVKILPFIRVDTLDYNVSNALKTTINPAAHDDGTTANDNFVSANDVFNTYRLVLLTMGTYHGNVYTIEDCVNATPDEIIIDGDVSAEIAATQWLQMIPPSATDCLYLGSIRLDGSGDLLGFTRDRWLNLFDAAIVVAGNKATSLGNTNLASVIPPTTKRIGATFYVAGNCAGASVHTAKGTTSNDYLYRPLYQLTGGTAYASYGIMTSQEMLLMTDPSILRNMIRMWNGSTWVAATTGDIYLFSFEE